MGTKPYDTRPIWGGINRPLVTPLTKNIQTEACVIGAGIAGLTTAYYLLREGANVVVIDREGLGFGETGLTSAHLANAMDDRFTHLLNLHGKEGVRRAAESHAHAINSIEEIAGIEGIDCEFKRVDGFLFCGDNFTAEDLKKEMSAAQIAGVAGIEMLAAAPTRLFNTGPCLRFPRQAQFHPGKYISGLAEAVMNLGGQIFVNTEACEVNGGGKGSETSAVTSGGYKISCDSIVVATNVPFNNTVSLHTKASAYRTYLIGLRVPEEKTESLLLWDTEDPYHYIRFAFDESRQENILLIGGEDHRTGQDTHPEKHFQNLMDWSKKNIHMELDLVTRWSGQIIEPLDGLAYIGRNPGDKSNVFIATGDSGQGLTHGTIAGMLIRDLIMKRKNPWEELYDPSRLSLRTLGTYMNENAHSAMPYTDWFSGGDVETVDDIQAGEGAIIRDGIEKIAVYRDTLGAVHSFSPVCPHLGGLVRWNTAEKSWDCPCHGSRFDKFGEVINGPSATGLKPIEESLIPVPQEVEEKLSPNQPTPQLT